MDALAHEMNRRRLLKLAAGGAAAAGLAPLLGAAPAQADPSAGNIKMWWWGQQEAVGIQTWMDDTIKKFKAQTGSSVSPTLMDTAQVIPQFTKAAAAGSVPDVQFLFNGIYHMENVWLGYLKPLNGLVSAATVKQGGGTSLSHLPGQVVPHGLLLARVRRAVQQGALRQGRASTPTRRRRRGTRSWTRATSSSRRATSRSAAASRTASSASGGSSTR